MKNIPLRDRAWPAPTPQEQAEIDEMVDHIDREHEKQCDCYACQYHRKELAKHNKSERSESK